MDDALAQLWLRFRRTGDEAARERLIVHYSPLVKYVASRVGAGMPQHVDKADLTSYGVFGLMDAIDRFDPDLGYKFETYASTRIRGAIIDELRAMDWVPRSVRRKSRDITTALRELRGSLLREPTDEEVAEEVGMTVEELTDALAAVSRSSVAALDDVFRLGDGETLSLIDTIEDTATVSPEANVDTAETRRILKEAITSLSDREQKVLALYYFDAMTLRQIGEIFGVTESRICQIHAKAVLSLRGEMEQRLAA